MPQSTHVQSNFTSGELSPRLRGRTDLKKYANGAEDLRNFIVQKHGGLIRRSGSRFVAEAKTPAVEPRLLPFKFSVAQNYILEFGNLYARFYRDKGRLQHGPIATVTGAVWIGGVASVTTSGNHGLLVGDTVSVQGTVTDYAPNPGRFNGTFVIQVINAKTGFEYALPTDATPGATTWQSGGTAVKVLGDNRDIATEIVTPYTTAQLAEIKFTQSADVLYLCHPSHAPQTLSRGTGADADPVTWTLAEFVTTDGPFLPENVVENADMTITELSGGGGIGATVTVVINGDAAAEINSGLGFELVNDVGRYITWQSAPDEDWTWAKITSITDERTLVATLESPTPLPGDPDPDIVTDSWRLGAWSITTGFPRAVMFHKSRLWFASNTNQPQTQWASRVGDFPNFVDFDRTTDDLGIVLADHALIYTIDDDRVNTIFWMVSEATGIAIFTNDGVFLGGKAQTFDALGPLNYTVTRQLTDGVSETVQPHQANEVILFAKNGAFKVLEFVFRFEDDRHVAPDLTLLSEHISLGGFVDSSYQSEPDRILWMVRTDGELVGMTYERSEEVVAWHRHHIGGSLTGSDIAQVKSVSTVRDGDDDQVWIVVKRTINSIGTHYIEFIPPLFADDETSEDAVFTDSGGTFADTDAIVSILDFGGAVQVTTATKNDLTNGDFIRIRGAEGISPLHVNGINDFTYGVTVQSATTFLLLVPGPAPILETSDNLGTHLANTGLVYRETTAIGGLTHLAGETVKILADGAVVPDQVVTGGGGITLAEPASIVHAGLAFTSRMKTMPLIPQPSQRSDPRGAIHRVDSVLMYLNRSIGGKVGSDAGLDPIITRKPIDPADQGTPLFTGLLKQSIRQRAGEQVAVIVETDDPLPLNLLSIISKLSTDEV